MSSEKKGFNWVMGCGIGCGGLILIGILAVGGIWIAVNRGMEAGRIAIAEEIQSDFATQLADAAIPEEHVELMTDLVGLATDEGTSFAMVLMCAVAYDTAVGENSDMDDEQRYEIVEDVVAFVSEDPSASFIKMGNFINDNPEYGELFEDLDDRGNSADFSFGGSNEEEEETPAPAEDSELEVVQ
jgi:hypothetical protein